MPSVTLVVTSCGRFELLEKTLSSLQDKYMFNEQIIIDDSGDAYIGEKIQERYGSEFTIILNEKNIGQISSIDKAYSLVKSDYIFHCEDDWFFYRSDFVAESINVLEENSNISMVSLRDWDNDVSINCHMQRLETKMTSLGIEYFVLNNFEHDSWGGYSFNPGLRRVSDYRNRVGNFSKIGHEKEISKYFLALNMNIALLKNSAVEHIGWGEHILSRNNPQEKFYYVKKMLPKKMVSLLTVIYRKFNK